MNDRKAILLAASAGFLLGVLVSFSSTAWTSSSPQPAAPPSEAADTGLLPQTSGSDDAIRRTPVVEAVARAAPAVVTIQSEVPTSSPFRFFYNLPNATTEGSGSIVRSNGVVLTNAHVVDGAVRITATLPDGQSFSAHILGIDDDLDLAVLQLEGAHDLPTIPLGTSSDLLLGETVIAIGNPFGLGHTVTTGVVSSVRRSLEVADRVYQDYIQTDAGINPGNSGGPLLNIRGELVGVTTAIRRDAENIGFAIPVDRAAKVARDLLRYGSVQSPWLGVAVEDVGGLRYAGTPLEKGAVVVKRVELSSAATAGLKPGDVILDVDGRSVHSRADLNLYLASRKPGETVHIHGLRGKREFTIQLQANRVPDEIAQALVGEVLGIEVEAIDVHTARAYGLRAAGGLLVRAARPGGSFAAAGLRAGDLILAVHGKPVQTEADLRQALVSALSSHRTTVLLTIQRGPYRGHVEVEL